MAHEVFAACSPERYFADDVESACIYCGVAVYVRPETAALVDASRRACWRCLSARLQGGDELRVTQRSLDEARLYFAVTGRKQ